MCSSSGFCFFALRQHLVRNIGQRERKVLFEEPGDVATAAAQFEYGLRVLSLQKSLKKGGFVGVVFRRRD
jgi:hypothetical protein